MRKVTLCLLPITVIITLTCTYRENTSLLTSYTIVVQYLYPFLEGGLGTAIIT